MTSFSGSYAPQDVIFLLKRATITPTPLADKEALIQSGVRHYSEMLSAETLPDARYLALFEAALDRNGARLGRDVASLAALIDGHHPAGRPIIIASLLRAGTPFGILLLRALRRRGRAAAHYSISIIRDRGIDTNALAFIAASHDPRNVLFVDGWTGKGTIAGELAQSLEGNRWGFAPQLAVIADPAGVTQLAASRADYLIPSGLLNAIVSGLVSRSVLNPAISGPDDFHACATYDDWQAQDQSRRFVDLIDGWAIAAGDVSAPALPPAEPARTASQRAIAALAKDAGITDVNRIKPGIAEATRALLRRVPDRLYLRDAAADDVAHLLLLARQQGIAIHAMPQADASPYQAITLIKSVDTD